ncbi:MAG: SUMF1/EgtB/PvdO family nonheme iron enzyme [Pseudomonadota bacterium]
MATIFVSHSSKDDPVTEDLIAWLHANGFNDTFADHLNILGGENWSAQIRAQAAACPVVLCMITPNWLASSDCFNEFQAAWYMGKKILPLFLVDPAQAGSDEPGRRLARVLAETQGIDLRKVMRADGRLDFDQHPKTADLLTRSLRAFGADARPKRKAPWKGIAAGVALVALMAGIYAYLELNTPSTQVDHDIALPGGLAHGDTFTDCEGCPTMVAVAGGQLLMGAPADRITAGDFSADQGPQRSVKITAFAIGQTEVTRAQFTDFLEASGHTPPSGCITWEDGIESDRTDRSFENPGYDQNPDHPVVCITWHDAQAYVDWLSRETGERYRLLSEAEWEFAARAGSDDRFFFGADVEAICRYDNVGDADAKARWPNWETTACSDGEVVTGPAGSYDPNGFGVYDIYGNVREWVRDCWHNNYQRAPDTSQAWIDVGCTARVARGGSWDSKPSLVASSWRLSLPAETRHFLYGFRVARELK